MLVSVASAAAVLMSGCSALLGLEPGEAPPTLDAGDVADGAGGGGRSFCELKQAMFCDSFDNPVLSNSWSQAELKNAKAPTIDSVSATSPKYSLLFDLPASESGASPRGSRILTGVDKVDFASLRFGFSFRPEILLEYTELAIFFISNRQSDDVRRINLWVTKDGLLTLGEQKFSPSKAALKVIGAVKVDEWNELEVFYESAPASESIRVTFNGAKIDYAPTLLAGGTRANMGLEIGTYMPGATPAARFRYDDVFIDAK